METIFDHNITEKEILSIVGVKIAKDSYERLVSQNKAYEDIYYLFVERGDKSKAQEYLDKLPNDIHKYFQVLNVDCGDYRSFKADE